MAVAFATPGDGHGIGVITLDNPPANSYDLTVMTEFSQAVDRALESGARAVVVRSASEKFPRDFDKGVPNRSV